jgi:peptidoglycan-N-acetylglucosamine deacetylase
MAFKGILRWIQRPQFLAAGIVVLLIIGGAMLRPAEAQLSPRVSTINQTSVQRAMPADCTAQACLALTFDDGPDVHLTPQVLDILKRHNAHATFFVQGSHVPGNEAILKRIHAEGHEIGNHSWGHPYFTKLTPEQIRQEIASTQEVIAKAGVPAPHLFRPPYGDINTVVMGHIPLTVVRWNIDPEDWHPNKKAYLLEHMASHARPGGVVIMHDTEATTVEKLEPLLVQLKTGNYTFVTVSELLSITPGQKGVYFNR